MRDFSSRTRLFGLIGCPVSHSLSPFLHNRWCREFSIDAVYLALPVHSGEVRSALRLLRDFGAPGVNVTLPHKIEAMQACTELTEAADTIGAVNSISFQGERIIGDNTDSKGFLYSLKDHEEKINSVCLWGAGGAARAVVHAVLELGAGEIWLFNRTREKAQTMAKDFSRRGLAQQATFHIGDPDRKFLQSRFHCTIDLFVNATSQGVAGIPCGEFWPPHFSKIKSDKKRNPLAYDLVYNPLATEFLRKAHEADFRTMGGLSMLAAQAAVSFATWFDKSPSLTPSLMKALKDQLSS